MSHASSNAHAFCRSLLGSTMEEVRQHYTPEQIKKVWVWDTGGGRKQFEFHGPDGEYIYNLDADCKWSALANGWSKLLAQKEDKSLETEKRLVLERICEPCKKGHHANCTGTPCRCQACAWGSGKE